MGVIVFVCGGKQKGEKGREFEGEEEMREGELLNRAKEIIR